MGELAAMLDACCLPKHVAHSLKGSPRDPGSSSNITYHLHPLRLLQGSIPSRGEYQRDGTRRRVKQAVLGRIRLPVPD